MEPNQVRLIKDSWEQVKPAAPQAAATFYKTLFELDPALESLFKNDISDQGKKLMQVLSTSVGMLDKLDNLVPVLQQLAQRHVAYGAKDEHYDTVGTALIRTLSESLGDAFTEELRTAWLSAYSLIASTMIEAANDPNISSNDVNTTSNEGESMNDLAKSQIDKAVQLQGALDQSGTATIMINRDFEVTYLNEATLNLLKQHEATFQKRWPDFHADADKLMGFCIDSFHANADHLRKLLGDPENLPYTTDIEIEDVKIELNVTAIYNGNGDYIGNSLEWQDVTEKRDNATRAARLQGAIDQSATAIIMIDRDFNVFYANQSTMALLQKHETTFQQRWPTFKADYDALIGLNIDVFHANPGHQRKLLGDPANLPYQTDINIEGVTIQLNVSAIYDNAGTYIGNSLEWMDVSAVQGMTTNLMMADLDGTIVYMNPALTEMLQRRESELRSVIPSFNVNELIGINFDTFHKNPAHQRGLLSNVANMPYSTEIEVAGLTFSLTAIALKDEDNNHVGTGVQWVDLTEEKDAQSQVDNLMSAAIRGELDQRIDTSSYSGFMKELGDSINSLMDNIIEPVGAAIDVSQALADGDLTKAMDGEFKGEFLALANAMNSSIENLSNMVGEISSASNSVLSAAGEIAQGNNDLSQRTESQASSLEETASAMEELTTTVQQNSENATTATKRASEAMEQARDGGNVVQNAVGAMEEITRFSKQIADIIGVIDEIAFQTNLLALNAAVEAARAGEQGRGFAVVAAEVRNLAQRSAGAAKEIKSLINDSVEAVGKGTKLVDDTGTTFTQLVDAVEEVVSMISDIDNAGKEQSAGINEISSAVVQMDEMTQRNAALVEEASASSKAMEEEARGLLDSISFFKTGTDDGSSQQKQSRASATGSSHERSSPRKAEGTDDEVWEEF